MTDLDARSRRRRAALPGVAAAGDAAAGDAAARDTAARRAGAARRRQLRQRRAVVLALAVLLLGTVVARVVEDPSDVTALGAAGSVTAAGTEGSDARGVDLRPVAAQPTPGQPVPAQPTPGQAPPAQPTPGAAPPPSTSPAATPHADADSDGSATPVRDAAGVVVPAAGTGALTALPLPAVPSAASGRPVRFTVEVEGGLPVAGADVARTVVTVLTDPRGWQARDGVRFVPVSPQELEAGAAVDIRVSIASPSLTARLCAPLHITAQQVSCWNGSRSVLNLTRWMRGSTTYGTDLAGYRVYLVSHEVGHGLGHGHVSCPAPGRPAPVMVQQTKSLEGCTPSPWPSGA